MGDQDRHGLCTAAVGHRFGHKWSDLAWVCGLQQVQQVQDFSRKASQRFAIRWAWQGVGGWEWSGK